MKRGRYLGAQVMQLCLMGLYVSKCLLIISVLTSWATGNKQLEDQHPPRPHIEQSCAQVESPTSCELLVCSNISHVLMQDAPVNLAGWLSRDQLREPLLCKHFFFLGCRFIAFLRFSELKMVRNHTIRYVCVHACMYYINPMIVRPIGVCLVIS